MIIVWLLTYCNYLIYSDCAFYFTYTSVLDNKNLYYGLHLIRELIMVRDRRKEGWVSKAVLCCIFNQVRDDRLVHCFPQFGVP